MKHRLTFIISILYLPVMVLGGATDPLLSDNFDSLSYTWQELTFDEKSNGSFSVDGGHLQVSGDEKYFYGVWNETSIGGHFIVELSFPRDERIGLMLIQAIDGKPDYENYTMLTVDTNIDGAVVVEVRDMQNGRANVLDHTGETEFEYEEDSGDYPDDEITLGPDLYKHVLTGDQYSVPFTKTAGALRILREANSDFFHYYYRVSKDYAGKVYSDWMELRPSPDWAVPGTEYFVGLVTLGSGPAVFDGILVEQKPMNDRDDRSTGFAVTQREYNWSGFMGDSYVITFDQIFKYHDRDIKFVFWTEMNWVPAWQLNDQLLYTYEFVETWDEWGVGCMEPMSDRLRQWAWVKVLEDNEVRKVLHWHYVLCNPDYEVPDNANGEHLPEVDEIWTFYPDGSGTRHIRYTPKLDTDFRAAHELGEFISIAGSKSHSSDFYAEPALSMRNLEGDYKEAHPGPKFDYYSDLDDWKQQILTVHFEEEPDLFCVWSVDRKFPETYAGYKIRYENRWQNPNIKCVHWPVNKRPYHSAYASGGTWKAEVSHACLLSWGVRDGEDWKKHYELDERGRKYREWTSLVGLNDPDNPDRLADLTRSWLFRGKVSMEGEGADYAGVDYSQKALVFNADPQAEIIQFTLAPRSFTPKIIHPVFEIRNWSQDNDSEIVMNAKRMHKRDYRTAVTEDGTVLVWIQKEIDEPTSFFLKR